MSEKLFGQLLNLFYDFWKQMVRFVGINHFSKDNLFYGKH